MVTASTTLRLPSCTSRRRSSSCSTGRAPPYARLQPPLYTVTGMPQPLRDANLAPRWWPASATNTFVLFTMKDASMSYHIDLWATAVYSLANSNSTCCSHTYCSHSSTYCSHINQIHHRSTSYHIPVAHHITWLSPLLGLLRGAVGYQDLRGRATP